MVKAVFNMEIHEGKANLLGYMLVFIGGALPLCNGRISYLLTKEFWTTK